MATATDKSVFDRYTRAADVEALFHDRIVGKNVLITGVSKNSIGSEVVRTLAAHAKTIWVCGRSKDRIQAVIDPILDDKNTVARIVIIPLDLTSTASIRAAAKQVNDEGLPIHVLYNNASILQPTTLQRTEDGFEAQFGGDHLGHFLFTMLLLPRLRQAATEDEGNFKPRVISIASSAHVWCDVRFDDPNFELRPEEYEAYMVYGWAKTANILFAREFAKRFRNEGLLAYAVHPGSVSTNMADALPLDVQIARNICLPDGTPNPNMYWKNLQEGSAGHIIAGFDFSIIGESGGYLVDGQIHNEKLAAWATSDENAVKLWVLSEELLGKSLENL